MNINIRVLLLFCILGASVLTNDAYADVDPTKYPLGISPKSFHNKLIADKFVFKKFTEKEIHAVKKVAVAVIQGSEIPNITESTSIVAKFCSGKMSQLIMQSSYGANRDALLLGRKNVYKYLKDNKAINDGIDLHKDAKNPRVVLSFLIDRNSQKSRDVRGTEIIKLSLDQSLKLERTVAKNLRVKVLKMTYFFQNKWFCPN